MLRSFRTALFWAHLAIGLAAGLLILLMSVTGVLLGFERQMIAAIDGAPRIAVTSGTPRPIDEALAAAGIATADVASVAVRRDPAVPITVRFHDRERAAALLDPFTGALLAPQAPGKAQVFFSALRRWHRWVGASTGALRTRMRALTGAANLAFLALVLSGLWLWWPRRWTLARLRATTVPSLRHSGKARDFNWHNSLGFWSAIPLALVVASGVFISYQWPGRWLDLALGSPAERAAARAPREEPPPRETRPAPRPTLDRTRTGVPLPIAPLLATAERAHPEWQSLTLTLAAGDAPTARIAVAEGNTYRPDLRTTLVVDRATAAVREVSGYADLSTSRRIRAWVRFGHTGEVFGLGGQLVATLVSAVGALLVWTGFALAWRRLTAFLRRRRAPPGPGRPAPSGDPVAVG